MSPLRAERDAAEQALVALRAEAVPALVAVLTATPDDVEQAAIGRASLLLGALGARDALPTLCALATGGGLRGDDVAFVARAVAELVGPRDALDPRVRAAVDALAVVDDYAARAFSADALGALGDERSRARVLALAADRDEFVRARAQAVLRRSTAPTRRALDDVSSLPVASSTASSSAHAAGAADGPLGPWLDDLGDARRAVRDHAVDALVRAGRAAVPALLARLNQPVTRARTAAAQALGRLQAPEATGPLLVAAAAPAATADEAELRAVSLRALAHCLTGSEAGLAPSLLPLARDPDRFVRAAALLCLGRVADRKGMRAVALALFEDDAFVVESAAIALSEGIREDDGDLAIPLVRALARPALPSSAAAPTTTGAVKEAILIALGRLRLDEPALRVRVRHAVRRDVAGTTASTRKAAIVLLERLFDDDDPPPAVLIDAVVFRLHDEHPDVRVVAGSFVARHLPSGMTGVVAALRKVLARRERPVTLLCLEALRRHDTDEAAQALRAHVDDDDVVVAERARALLADFVPASSTWAFSPRASSSKPPQSALPGHRTRPPSAAAPRTVVDARFDDEPRRG
jgi:HEAT repeat protein